MGFGHRVYKTGDPRTQILQPYCTRLATEVGDDRWETNRFDPIERAVTAQKHLPPNVDWPSRPALSLHEPEYRPVHPDLPPMARVAGVVGRNIIEQLDHNRLMRPRCASATSAPPTAASRSIDRR